MKLSEIREKTMEELSDEVVSLKKNLFDLRMQLSTHKLEDTSQIAKTKSLIAKIKTVIREKQLEVNK